MKPMLANDYVEEKVKFPVIMQPKIDGVRGAHLIGSFTGRSLKAHKNRQMTEFFSHPAFSFMDGEVACARATHPDLCRITSSAMSTRDAKPLADSTWFLFDFVAPGINTHPYVERIMFLHEKMEELERKHPELWAHVQVVRSELVHDIETMRRVHARHMEMGYEGSCLRDPYGKFKQGRSTVREGGLLRIKDFSEEEAEVLEIIEGDRNENEATVNELGQTTRSTHKANMVPNGMVGKLICKDLKTGKTISVAAGCLTHAERLHLFNNPHHIIGQIIKYRTFLHGVKDLPRFPTYQGLRSAEDMS